LTGALVKVVKNKGAPGADGQTVEELRGQWPTAGPALAASLLAGCYRPGMTRRVEIPKAGAVCAGWGSRM
jgi:RNA-directed DNA polymerase